MAKGSIEPYDLQGRLWSEVGGAPAEILPFNPERFEVGDERALEYLAKNGYVVFSNVATAEELHNAEDIFWKGTERAYKGVKRDKMETWDNEKWKCLAATRTGVVSNDSSGHSPFMWYVRGIEKIKQAFASVWSDDDLLVSFDGYGAYRPPEKFGSTRGGWFHVDQNGSKKRGLHCVQGLLNIFPSGPQDGGLVVVPGSNNQFDEWFEDGRLHKRGGDFVMLAALPMMDWWGTNPIKLCLEAGDFVMWDSRTSHCSHPARPIPGNYPERLRRLVAYVCMTPCSKAKDLKQLRIDRMRAFEEGDTLNHWPHEYNPHPTDKRESTFTYRPQELNEHQKSLIVGKSGM